MVARADIEQWAQRIAQEFKPERIILFGSYAYGKPSPDSDVDLLVVMPHSGKAVEKSVEILRRCRPRFPADVIVRDPEVIKQRLAWNDFFLKEIVTKGEVLYEPAHAGVD